MLNHVIDTYGTLRVRVELLACHSSAANGSRNDAQLFVPWSSIFDGFLSLESSASAPSKPDEASPPLFLLFVILLSLPPSARSTVVSLRNTSAVSSPSTSFDRPHANKQHRRHLFRQSQHSSHKRQSQRWQQPQTRISRPSSTSRCFSRHTKFPCAPLPFA